MRSEADIGSTKPTVWKISRQFGDGQLRDFNSVTGFGRGVVNLYLKHRKAVFQLNRPLLRAFLCLEFGLDATVYFESVSGILHGRIPHMIQGSLQ
jgi:hypothetical protein